MSGTTVKEESLLFCLSCVWESDSNTRNWTLLFGQLCLQVLHIAVIYCNKFVDSVYSNVVACLQVVGD